MMTSKERMRSAMNLMPADKVPLMCQFSIGHMLLQLNVSPSDFWFDEEIFVRGLIHLREIYGFDGILVSLHGHNPDWKKSVIRTRKSMDAEIVEWENGDKTICPFNDLPYFEYRDIKKKIDVSDFKESDLPEIIDYIPVSGNLHFQIFPKNKFGSIEKIVRECGDQYSIHGEITSPFDYFLDISGYQDGLLGLVIYPDNCKRILSHFTDKIKALAVEMCATGVDAIKLSSPFAGSGFISPQEYSEFVVPYEREIASEVREHNIHIYTHTCGSINDRLELMFDTGISGIECLDTPPLGDVELRDAFKRINNRGFIKGNIDSVNLLLNGARENIITGVQEILNNSEGYPGFILSTACSIAPAVSREKIRLLRKVVDNYGK